MSECSKCGKGISTKVYEYSMKNYNKPLCMDCQKEPTKEEVDENIAKEEKIDRPKQNKTEEHIVKINGKEFITFAGLLEIAHIKGIKKIETELLPETKYIFRAKVTMKDGASYDGHGDANENNVGKMIKPHIIRMAETRAVARALRLATNIGMCSLEELDQ